MKKSDSVAIIGAGLAGLSCAQVLRNAGVSVRIFEKAGSVGGRCATQLWQGHLVDTGVQYFTAQSSELKKELLTRLRQFRPIISPIIDAFGQPVPNNMGPRFYVLQGNNYFAHVLSGGLDLQLNCEIEPVKFKSDGVHLNGETFLAVVSALPGPESARALGLAQSPAQYDACLVGLLEYAGTDLGRVREAYARHLGDTDHILRSSHCENNKVGRVVGNKTVFVVQSTPLYSSRFADSPPDDYLPALAARNEEIWQIPTGRLTASFGLSWRVAWPHSGSRTSVQLPLGAFLCGDSRTDPNVEDVWLDGQKAGLEVLQYLNKTA